MDSQLWRYRIFGLELWSDCDGKGGREDGEEVDCDVLETDDLAFC